MKYGRETLEGMTLMRSSGEVLTNLGIITACSQTCEKSESWPGMRGSEPEKKRENVKEAEKERLWG